MQFYVDSDVQRLREMDLRPGCKNEAAESSHGDKENVVPAGTPEGHNPNSFNDGTSKAQVCTRSILADVTHKFVAEPAVQPVAGTSTAGSRLGSLLQPHPSIHQPAMTLEQKTTTAAGLLRRMR